MMDGVWNRLFRLFSCRDLISFRKKRGEKILRLYIERRCREVQLFRAIT